MATRSRTPHDNSGAVRLERPKAFPVRKVRADLKKLFLRLGEAAAQGSLFNVTGSGSLPSIATAVFGAAEAFSVDTPPGERAWRLVRNALTRATGDLVRERFSVRPVNIGDLAHLAARIEITIDDDDVHIGQDFFRNPAVLKILPAVRRSFASWLRLLDVGPKEAEAMANRLDSYFCLALRDEWRAHRELYEPLRQHFDDPFADAARMEEDWERNRLSRARPPLGGPGWTLVHDRPWSHGWDGR